MTIRIISLQMSPVNSLFFLASVHLARMKEPAYETGAPTCGKHDRVVMKRVHQFSIHPLSNPSPLIKRVQFIYWPPGSLSFRIDLVRNVRLPFQIPGSLTITY
jgi:hypothetical protein